MSEPFYIAVRATRTSGWINFRVGPSKITGWLSAFPDGKELIVIGETTNWYHARDPESGKVGYIHKNYTTKLVKPVTYGTETEGSQQLGKLAVNGEFRAFYRVGMQGNLRHASQGTGSGARTGGQPPGHAGRQPGPDI